MKTKQKRNDLGIKPLTPIFIPAITEGKNDQFNLVVLLAELNGPLQFSGRKNFLTLQPSLLPLSVLSVCFYNATEHKCRVTFQLRVHYGEK